MTLEQYCTDAGIDADVAIEKLRTAGVTATRTTTIREIADAAGLHPSAVRGLLERRGTPFAKFVRVHLQSGRTKAKE